MKNQYIWGKCLKGGGGAEKVLRFKGGGLAKKGRDGVFLGGGGLIPHCTL